MMHDDDDDDNDDDEDDDDDESRHVQPRAHLLEQLNLMCHFT